MVVKKKWSAGIKALAPAQKTETSNKPYTWDPRPEIRVKDIDLPEIKDWKVGEEYELKVVVKMESYSDELNSDTKKNEVRATLRVIGIGSSSETQS